MNLVGPVEDVVGAARGLVAIVPSPALPLALSWPRVVLVSTAPVPPVPAVPWLQYKLSI